METPKTETVAAPAALPIIKDPRICLSMPVYNKIDVPFVQCLMAMCASTSFIGTWDFLPGDSLVNRARNNLAKRFLDGFPGQTEDGKPATLHFDWMLFLDTDLVFRADDVKLLYELGLNKGPGIYVGTYPIKQLKPKVVFNNMPGCIPDKEGIVEVREAGTGFMLIHRDVFEQMKEKFKDEITYQVDMGDMGNVATYQWDFFSVGVYFDPQLQRKRFLSEDWYFCQRWRAMGGKVLMQTKISCNHIGQFAYPGNPQEIIDAADHLKRSIAAIQAAKQPLVVKVGPPEKFVSKEEPVAVAV